MLRIKKVTLAGILLLVVVAAGAVWFTPLHSSLANLVSPRPASTYSPRANGPYTVKGNTVLDANGQPYNFYGVGRDSLEYMCRGLGSFDTQHLSYIGAGTNGSSANGPYYWYANTVRLPLSEAIWLKGQPSQGCTATQYHQFVRQVVNSLTTLHLNVVIDLQWTDAGGQAAGGSGWQMADNDSVTFWKQVATIYRSYSNVLFELFNEPHPSIWACVISGCKITGDTSWVGECQCQQTFDYQAVGMQALVNAVRSTGAKNLVAAAGMVWGYDLSQYMTTPLAGSNIIYDTHPYDYPNKQPNTWDASFGNLTATAPVVSLEFGEYDCNSHYISQLLPYFDAHKISWVAWSWVSINSTCTYPQLISDEQGTPAVSMGTYIYSYLHSYAGVPTGPIPVAMDTFHRADQSLWGSANNAQTWAGDANTMSVFSISGNTALVSNTGTTSYSAVLGSSQANNAEVYVTGSLSLFTNSNFGGVLRWTDGNNWYKAYIDGVNLVIQMKVAGTATVLATVPFAATAGTSYTIHFRVVGSTLTANAWASTGTEPSGWMATATDSTLTSGFCGIRVLTQTGTATFTSFMARSL